jgi:hypothetical protein
MTNKFEELTNFISSNGDNYYSIKRLSRRFNLKKRILLGYLHSNHEMFEITNNGLSVGVNSTRKLFVKYKYQKFKLEIE